MNPLLAYVAAGTWAVIGLWEVGVGRDAMDAALLMSVWLAYAKGCEILEVLRGGK